MADLPPSAKFVVYVLSHRGAMTGRELHTTTALPTTTLHRALDTLEDAGRVETHQNPDEPRAPVYVLTDDPDARIGTEASTHG